LARTLVCLSHLRWDFVYQRPNHLMARAARQFDVLFVEEPVWDDGPARLELLPVDGLTVVRPHLPGEAEAAAAELDPGPAVSALLRRLLAQRGGGDPVLWYYTPMALSWTDGIHPAAVVYDCMDELSAFRSAPQGLIDLETTLLRRADLVFTGGRSLYEAKRARSPRVHCFPSSVDCDHFGRARDPQADPTDQAAIPRPRLGYFGVIDERLDLELLGEVARRRPDWQVVLVGPVAKIDPADIPALPNVHQLGRKEYADLPAYLAGWDVALMPFARNEATRYISPTKTPEYLAGGVPVVSTSIRDVVDPYGRAGLVRIADTADDTCAAIEATLAAGDRDWLAAADMLLGRQSWEATWAAMAGLLDGVVKRRRPAVATPVPSVRVAAQPHTQVARPVPAFERASVAARRRPAPAGARARRA
jgi:glycosyltransferase involved in cell wall biosynthesis